MIKTKLTVSELYSLDAELQGLVNQKTNEVIFKGILHEEIPVTAKYWLNRLSDKTSSIKSTAEKINKELIEKYGELDEVTKNYRILHKIEEKDSKGKVVKKDGKPVMIDNPNYIAYNKEIKEVYEQEHEIEHAIFKLEDFDLKTSGNYPTLYKILTSSVEELERLESL